MVQCLEVMEQDQVVMDQVQGRAKACGVVKGKEEWVDLSPQDQAEIASARVAGQRFLILPDSPAIK